MWSTNNINSGLGTLGSNTRPSSFVWQGNLYLVVNAGTRGTFKAYKFNTTSSAWEVFTPFQTFSSSNNGLIPCVFAYNNELYCYLADNDGLPALYKYDGSTRWVSNTIFKTGIPIVSWSAPNIFTFGTDLFLIMGNDVGTFVGYKWNSASLTWESNTSIISGLTDVGSYSRPSILFIDGTMYLIAGHSSGFAGFKWTGSAWTSNSAIIAGISSLSNNTPTVVDFNSNKYLFNGNSDGTLISYLYAPDPPAAKLSSITFQTNDYYTTKLVVTLSAALTPGETLKAFYSQASTNLTDVSNQKTLTKQSDLIYYCIFSATDNTPYYLRAEQLWNGQLISNVASSGTLLLVAQKYDTAINITNASNYHIFSSPNGHARNHGLIYYNNFIYGSARSKPIQKEYDVFKINSSNYLDIVQKAIYLNKNAASERLTEFDQIIQCSGFIWLYVTEYLIRLNANDLDYMIFKGLPPAYAAQPIVTDGINIFLPTDTSLVKIDPNFLTNSFSYYGYTGAAAVQVPAESIKGSCPIIQIHPTKKCYTHSSLVDAEHVFLANTTTVGVDFDSGYDAELGIYCCNIQKIKKSDMSDAGHTVIPKATDDMVQDSNYIFLAPEFPSNYTNDLLGALWGLFAVKKADLSIKYLKALRSDQYSSGFTPIYRNGFGVFYFNNKIVIQQSQFKRTIVIDLARIEEWGDNFPIGGATEAVYKFQLNGTDLAYPCNELVLDNSGVVHTNTWQEDTMIFKFNVSQLTTVDKTPNIQTTLKEVVGNSATLGGFVIDEGKSPITSGGFKWGTSPDQLTNTLPVTPFGYSFQAVLSNLTPGAYYFAAYGTNTEGTFLGNVVMFTVQGYNCLILNHNDSIALLSFVDSHFGCSIRCVQDAPGVADGTTGTATDQDGNVYDTVVINEKRWMVQNLKTTKFRNGDTIPEITDNTAWQNDSAGAHCLYENKRSNL